MTPTLKAPLYRLRPRVDLSQGYTNRLACRRAGSGIISQAQRDKVLHKIEGTEIQQKQVAGSWKSPYIHKRDPEPHLFAPLLQPRGVGMLAGPGILGFVTATASLTRVLRHQAVVDAHPASPLMKRASLMVRFLGSSSSLHDLSIGDCCCAAFLASAEGGGLSLSSLCI
jgi:hypothetical protein